MRFKSAENHLAWMCLRLWWRYMTKRSVTTIEAENLNYQSWIVLMEKENND